MSLTIVRRKDTGALTISGYVYGRRVQVGAQSNDPKVAAREAALYEAELINEHFHGKRRGVWTFAYAAEQYELATAPKGNTIKRLRRLIAALGDAPLRELNQEALNRLQRKMLRPNPAPATVLREIITPVRAVINYAIEQGEADPIRLRSPRVPKGRTIYLLPGEAERLITAAAAHLKPLLVFLLGTGARLSEALELDWRAVKLSEARASLRKTKSGRERHAHLPPHTVATLANLEHREGAVFLRPERRSGRILMVPYAAFDRDEREAGGQIKTAFRGAMRRAGLGIAGLSPHALRHTWASWHNAIHKDLLRLQIDGGWSSINQVVRYAHLLDEGQEAAIAAFWNGGGEAEQLRVRA
jgi:integrase